MNCIGELRVYTTTSYYNRDELPCVKDTLEFLDWYFYQENPPEPCRSKAGSWMIDGYRGPAVFNAASKLDALVAYWEETRKKVR